MELEVLRNTKASSIASLDIIIVFHNTSVGDTLKVLAENNILSVPVFDTQNVVVMGSVDVIDLMCFLMLSPNEDGDQQVVNTNEQIKERFNLPVGDAVDKSTYDPFIPITEDKSIADIITLFSIGVHRVPIIKGTVVPSPVSNEAKNLDVIAILSQSDVIRFLFENLSKLPSDLVTKTLKDLGLVLGKDNIVAAKQDTTLSKVFEVIVNNNFSGLPIVDNDGKLVANFSTTDLRGINQNNFPDITQPVIKFVETQTPTARAKTGISPNTTLAELAAAFSSQRRHRFDIVDESNVPVGVVTLTDVCKILREYKGK